MPKNCLRITHQGENIQLSWQRGQASPRVADAVKLEHPFNKKALTDLRWYLEEYLRFPYGIFPDEAAKIEQKLQSWGEELFNLVFRSSEKAREFFQVATYDGLHNCELAIASDDFAILNLPWELLYSPGDRQFLAPSLAGMSRSLSDYAVRGEIPKLPQDKLNILLVIARPYGETDIALKTIARPLLDSVSEIRQKVNIKVLRPPSFEEFERELSANKGFYHIVHFDGHGDFDHNSQGFQHSLGGLGQGVLVFENVDGSPQIVTAAQIAQNLADCGVPIFVLNACKSAQEGEDKFSSVATRLVSSGAKGVVAMAYSVYAVAAKHFIGRLYGELVKGANLSQAVAAGRKAVLNQPQRPSPKGDKILRDWIVPVLYEQESYAPFIPEDNTDDIFDIDTFLESEETVTQLVGFPDEGAYGFIGRDYDILRLERAFRQNNIVLMKGMGGVGKTELSCGFARWLEETQGRDSKMFFVSFEHGATLVNVISQVGREVWKDQLDKFNSLPIDKQQAAVLKYLQKEPCLLIWDNFEPVNGFPTGNQPLLIEEERNELKQFLKQLRNGKTWVLITSRREEAWLDCGYTLLNLGGLIAGDVEELAAKILQTAGIDKRKLPKEYLELLKLLGGHPLSLRVVLPHLKTQTSKQLIEALRQGLDTFAGEEEGRDKSLTVSLDYSFSKLSEKARRHLPFLGLFCERVNVHILSNFSKEFGFDNLIGFGKTYQSIFGIYFEIEDWQEILNETEKAGILEDIGDGIFRLYPALPWYLRQKLSQNDNANIISKLENQLLIFYLIIAVAHDIQDEGNAEQATTILMLEEPNLLQYFRLSLNQNDWITASGILKSLGQVYDILGLSLEYGSLRERAFHKIGLNLVDVKAQDESAFKFWAYLKGADALEALRRGDLEKARIIHQQILNEYKELNDSSVIDEIAIAYANLGTIAREQHDYDGAISYYQSALKIYQDVSNYQEPAVYYELGVTARQQGNFELAINYYQSAFKIYQDAGDYYRLIGIYQEMGVIARYKGNFDKAIFMYKKALYLCEELGHNYFSAGVYHELGKVAQLQGNLFLAQQFYYKSLQIYEDTQDLYNASDEYQSLGELAKIQRNYDEAIAYFQKAFNTRISVKAWRKVSETSMEWGKTLEVQQDYVGAVKPYIYTLVNDINNQHYPEWVAEGIECVARMLRVLGENQFDTIWREVTGGECAGEVRKRIWAARDKLDTEGEG